MLTENHIKEGLSRAFILAVAHRAGFNCSLREFDYGVDGTFNEIKIRGARRIESGFAIDFQAKASGRCIVGESEVEYDLEAKSYNDLVDSDRAAKPYILIMLALPTEPTEWLQVTSDGLLLRRCAWWLSLRGMPPTDNDKTKRITIPRANVFDVAAVTRLMERTKQGEQF